MKKFIRTYGRTKSRNMDLSILEDHQFIYKVLPDNLIRNKIELEIGFGNGENLIHRSILFPDSLHIGVDVYKNGICKILKFIDKEKKDNIAIFNEDIREFLENHKLLFDVIYIMFPDPWDKKSLKTRERKRLVNKIFLDRIIAILKINGLLFFASDHKDYYDVILQYAKENKDTLSILSETVNQYLEMDISNYFVQSNYEKKATNDRYYIKIQKVRT